jgi:dTDP-4-dehydrorhamnose 3,5-epimerase
VIVRETPLAGAFELVPEPIEDERGFFARVWDRDELAALGLEVGSSQCSVAFNHAAGTLRGLHFQAEPHAETKLVRCTRGAVHDVIVDIRPGSATFARWTAVELSERNRTTLYVPKGFAHGYQTLEDGSEVWYQMADPYVPESQRGLRWDDPRLGIEWPPAARRVISARDEAWPPFAEAIG